MFTKGEVIWAKIKGFPWWPGVVAKVIEDKDNSDHATEILVNFIGENSHARLPLDKVAKFEENYVEFSKMKKKKLLESIDIAKKIISGETTYEEERERLERKEKGLPVANVKRKKDGKDSVRDEESENESEEPPSPASSKNKAKIKFSEKKNNKMKQSNQNVVKSPIASTADRSPAIMKNKRAMSNMSQTSNGTVNGTYNRESDLKDIGKPRIRKMLKLDNEPEEQRQILKENTPHLNIQTIPIQKSASETIEIERKPERPITKPGRPPGNPFLEIHETLIEKIANADVSNLQNIEKKINAALTKLNVESASLIDLLDRDVGKNIHTLLILIDELANKVQNVDPEILERINNLHETLLTASNTLKVRLSLHFVENIDFCSGWIKKLNERIEIRENERREAEKKEQEPEVEVINPRDTKVRKEPSQQKSVADKDSIVSEQSGSKENNDKMIDELSNGISSFIEEEKMNGEESNQALRDLDDNKPKQDSSKEKNPVTTSTKLPKPKPKSEPAAKQQKPAETKPKDSAINTLRKKICLKMAKFLQDKHNITKDEAQDLTLKIESKVRNIFSEINEYRDKILIILKLIKFSLFNLEEFLNNPNVDFSELSEKVEAYQKHNAEAAIGLDTGLVEDTPSFTRESKSESIGAHSENNGEGINIESSN